MGFPVPVPVSQSVTSIRPSTRHFSLLKRTAHTYSKTEAIYSDVPDNVSAKRQRFGSTILLALILYSLNNCPQLRIQEINAPTRHRPSYAFGSVVIQTIPDSQLKMNHN
jgi:hypothetical protein